MENYFSITKRIMLNKKYETEERTNIEELWNERIAAFNVALNERITGTKLELEFQKRQNEVIRKEKEFNEIEQLDLKKKLTKTYWNNSELRKQNELMQLEIKKLNQENKDLLQEKEQIRIERNSFRNLYYKVTKK